MTMIGHNGSPAFRLEMLDEYLRSVAEVIEAAFHATGEVDERNPGELDRPMSLQQAAGAMVEQARREVGDVIRQMKEDDDGPDR